ncbi:hypothetical protein FACS1894151_06220 [Spirochaetia bacterium]|nr:hypothetical protein FACS1894151_06220 [Spirochaetia bacterium]
MKLHRILFGLGIALIMALPLTAQEGNGSASPESAYYYQSVPIEKVYTYRKGYVVQYRKGAFGTARAYLPIEWFSGAGAKGEVIQLKSGSSWPYLTVFYKDGEFDHVRLYVRTERGHESWGYIGLGVNIDDRFEGVEDLRLQY